VPRYDDFDWNGLDFGEHRFSRVMNVDLSQWERELDSHDAFFRRLGSKRPDALMSERDRLAGRIAM
jgi:phosphoenolpyruvate carboxykinase (GTP)